MLYTCITSECNGGGINNLPEKGFQSTIQGGRK